MAFVLADRVKETTTTTGTGTVTLLGASTGYQSFAVIGNANTTYYTIAGQTGSEWEVGIGTYTSSGTTLARTTVISSSNSGSLVNFSAGTKDVFVTYPAEYTANAVGGGIGAVLLNADTVTVSGTIATGQNGFSVGISAVSMILNGLPAGTSLAANNGLMYGAFYDVTNSAYVNLPPAVGSRKQAHWFKRTTSADANDADDMNFSAQVTNTNTTTRT